MLYCRPLWPGLLLLWPVAAIAGSVSFGDTVSGFGWKTFAGWLALSLLAGLTSLFYRMNRELERTRQRLPHPGLFVAANMGGSLVMGLIAMLTGEGFRVDGALTAVSILVFSFGGAQGLERFVTNRMRAVWGEPITDFGALDKKPNGGIS